MHGTKVGVRGIAREMQNLEGRVQKLPKETDDGAPPFARFFAKEWGFGQPDG
jgi:hypothetical protein